MARVVSFLFLFCASVASALFGTERGVRIPSGDTSRLSSPAIKFPKIDRRPAPADFGRGAMATVPTYDPKADWLGMDLRGYDLTGLDLSNSYNDLMYATFDDVTAWPPEERMPASFDPLHLKSLNQSPGLRVRTLHAKGTAGHFVGIAIIDQPVLTEHVEFATQLRLYEEINVEPTVEAQMHGAAVASIAVGKTLGVAPEADLYYIGAWPGDWIGSGGFAYNFSYYARGIRRILQINQQLPSDRKIRVIAMQVGWNPGENGYEEITQAVVDAEQAGLLVISSSMEVTHPLRKFHALGRWPLADPNRFSACRPALWWADDFQANPDDPWYSNRLLAPSDSRLTASPTGPSDYVFYREGGWSWTIPYIAGMYALAAQVDPSITPGRFWTAALKTGRTIQYQYEDTPIRLGPILDPVLLIKKLTPR